MFDRATVGDNAPDEINVIIEIPADSSPVKYEIDKECGLLAVDRFMSTSMVYPCNYGYVPKTLCGDGDPLDVLVVSPFPLYPCSLISCRPVGMMRMTDESGVDAKILAVPSNKLTMAYHMIKDYRDLPDSIIKSIAHFFEHYKDLEDGKWVNIDGWYGVEEAKAEIIASIQNY